MLRVDEDENLDRVEEERDPEEEEDLDIAVERAEATDDADAV